MINVQNSGPALNASLSAQVSDGRTKKEGELYKEPTRGVNDGMFASFRFRYPSVPERLSSFSLGA